MAAIRAAFRALSNVEVTEPVTEHSDMFATLVWHAAHEFFDAAHAERCRLFFENAVTKAGTIPVTSIFLRRFPASCVRSERHRNRYDTALFAQFVGWETRI